MLGKVTEHPQKNAVPKFAASHSATLSTTSNVVTYPAQSLSFKPDYWLIVVRLTAGYVLISPGGGRVVNNVKLDYGVVEIPTQAEQITIEAVGATGFYSVYAVADKAHGFMIYD